MFGLFPADCLEIVVGFYDYVYPEGPKISKKFEISIEIENFDRE